MVTCDVRLLIRFDRPIDRGMKRFWMVPPSTATCFTTSASASTLSFSAALAMAEPRTFTIISAALRRCARRIDSASPTGRPRIMSATTRTLRGDSRRPLKAACAICLILCLFYLLLGRGGRRAGGGLAVARVAVEGPGGRELAQLVADHVLVHEHGDELLPVVNREGQPHHRRDDGRSARPGLEDLLRLLPLHDLLFLLVVGVVVGAFLVC